MEKIDNIPENYKLNSAIQVQEENVSYFRRLNDHLKILNTAITMLSQRGLEVSNEEIAEGAYSYIPIGLNEFFEAMFKLDKVLANDSDYKHKKLRYRPCSVLEVGCGIGRNVFLLKATNRFQFSSVSGFDIIEEYIKAGQQCFGLKDELFVDDCMKIDYSEYDVIFFYRPFSDSNLEVKFEDHLIESMKSGAYIVSFLNEKLDESRLLISKDDSGTIWKRA